MKFVAQLLDVQKAELSSYDLGCRICLWNWGEIIVNLKEKVLIPAQAPQSSLSHPPLGPPPLRILLKYSEIPFYTDHVQWLLARHTCGKTRRNVFFCKNTRLMSIGTRKPLWAERKKKHEIQQNITRRPQKAHRKSRTHHEIKELSIEKQQTIKRTIHNGVHVMCHGFSLHDHA